MGSARTAVVTGAASGIGQAIARRLADEGYRVVGADLSWPEAGDPSLSMTVACDVTKASDVATLFERAREPGGSVAVLVNAAGVDHVSPIVDLTEQEWRRVLDVNLFGTFLCLQQAARIMRDQGGGRIVNIASNKGLDGLANGAAYAASKGGVLALTKSAAMELAQFDVGVFAILPGATVTPMLRGTGGRANPPEFVAAAVMPLLEADALSLNGASFSVPRRPRDD